MNLSFRIQRYHDIIVIVCKGHENWVKYFVQNHTNNIQKHSDSRINRFHF